MIPAGVGGVVSVAGIFLAILFRGELLYTALNVKTVTSTGRPASWARAAARGVVGWSPALALGYLFWFFEWDELTGWRAVAWGVPVLLVHACLVVGIVAAVRNPARGLQERLTGTTLVPR